MIQHLAHARKQRPLVRFYDIVRTKYETIHLFAILLGDTNSCHKQCGKEKKVHKSANIEKSENAENPYDKQS